jgi:hypothetical protein
MRGRRSCQGGRRCGQRGAAWWRRVRYGVSGVGEQPEMAVTGEVLTEEDDGRGIPLLGFASRRCGQVLGAGGGVVMRHFRWSSQTTQGWLVGGWRWW